MQLSNLTHFVDPIPWSYKALAFQDPGVTTPYSSELCKNFSQNDAVIVTVAACQILNYKPLELQYV